MQKLLWTVQYLQRMVEQENNNMLDHLNFFHTCHLKSIRQNL